eukprot:364997-Chlamydomonas_euryale.AAC.2
MDDSMRGPRAAARAVLSAAGAILSAAKATRPPPPKAPPCGSSPLPSRGSPLSGRGFERNRARLSGGRPPVGWEAREQGMSNSRSAGPLCALPCCEAWELGRAVLFRQQKGKLTLRQNFPAVPDVQG